MNSLAARAVDWFDDRTGLVSAVKHFLDEDIPASSGWHQVFGSVALFLFLLQVFTGILLAFNYVPQPGASYFSLQAIINELTGGRIIHGLHHWGASMMVVVVVMHMIQVALWGAYKKPRETTWLVGVVLLLLVLGFGLTGYLLPGDNRAYWSTVVTIQISALVPGAGEFVMRLLGSPDGTVGVSTFSRFYALHVLLLPAVTAFLIILHVYLVIRHGVTPAPQDAGRPSKKFYPEQAFKDTMAVFGAFVILFVMAVAIDAPLERVADPTDTSYIPRPEWYFLFLFQTLKFFEGSLEVIGAVILPTLAIGALFLVPFIDRGRAKKVGQRTLAWGIVTLAAAGWAGLTIAAIVGAPEQPASKSILAAAESWAQLTPVELAGAACYRREKCATCHNLVEGEPKMGPTLAMVGQKRSADWMIDHLRNPSGVIPGSPMPAVQLSPALLNCLSAFLLKVTPENALALDKIPEFAMQGAMVYQMNMCGNCHIINGLGGKDGPPLNGVGQRRTKEWLAGHFRDPQAFSPDSLMPSYNFPPDEMEAIVEYLMSLPPK